MLEILAALTCNAQGNSESARGDLFGT